MPQFLLPFGPFHMVMLHLPIGALTAIWFLEILIENKGEKHKNPAIGLLHLFLVLSCGLTIALGLSYAEFGQYGDEIDQHELWGYIFGAAVLVCYALYWTHRKLGRSGTKFAYMLSLLAATIAMVITGHQGGELIHGKAFLSKPFKTSKRPAPLLATTEDIQEQPRPASTSPTKIAELTIDPTNVASSPAESTMETVEPAMHGSGIMDEMSGSGMMDEMSSNMMDTMAAVVPPPTTTTTTTTTTPPTKADPRIALFESTQAIFERNCTKCHGPTKQKGDYRLDGKHSINLGGKSKLPAIVPGKAKESELMYRMLLPRTDDDAMPPESKDPVSAEDIDTIRQWIEAGAYWPDDSELSAAPGKYVKVGDADTDVLIAQINRTGAKTEYNAWADQSVRIDLGVVDPNQLNEAISQLNQLSKKLTWLDCSDLKLSAGFFKEMQRLQLLDRLHLNGTNVTDEQLVAVSQLPKLSYLNLYNTAISDTGLSTLQDCPNLQKVYLSQTQVTIEGIAQLKSAKPNLEVIYLP